MLIHEVINTVIHVALLVICTVTVRRKNMKTLLLSSVIGVVLLLCGKIVELAFSLVNDPLSVYVVLHSFNILVLSLVLAPYSIYTLRLLRNQFVMHARNIEEMTRQLDAGLESTAHKQIDAEIKKIKETCQELKDLLGAN